MHANLPRIAKRWERDYANGGIARVGLANGSSYKQNILDQYQNIASQYNQPVTYTDSPVFQAGFEKWNPYGIGSYLAQGVQKAKSALGLNTAATAAPFGGGMYVPPKEDAIAEYSKYISDPETATALGESDWATQFGHETSHLGWEYENLAKQLASISPHLKTSASNPSYAGEEQWNYMNDLMYGPRYDEDVHGRPGEDYLTTKGLINKGDLSYTPEAFDVIAKSGLITPHKRAIGFGKNPHEDTMMGKMRSYPNRSIPEDKIKAMRQDLRSVPRPLGFDTSYGVANEVDVAQKPLTQKKGNIFKKGWQGIKKGWQGAKDFKTSIGEGITGILDNTMLGKFAAMNDATNRRAFNYNPALQGQIDYLKGRGDYGVMDASGLNKITGGVLAGKNLQSLFGSNDLGKMYDKSIALTQKTIKNFDKQWSRLKKDDPDEYYKKLAFHENKLKQKEREKKLAGIAASKDLEKRKAASKANWQQDYSTWTSPSGRDHAATAGIGSKESKQGPAGGSIGASRFLARGGRASYFNGGLASLWPR